MTVAWPAPERARRPSLGRWRGPAFIAVTVVVAYLLLYIGVVYAANNVNQPLSFNDALSQTEQQFINAITIGAVYALIALGYTMVYGIIELINFAHGEIFMCGSFVSWW